MLAQSFVEDVTNRWIAAWDGRDLDIILSHYADGIELTSPIAAALLGDPSGTVRGKQALREYFSRGLARYPDLHFIAERLYVGAGSFVLQFRRPDGMTGAEFMELDGSGKIVRVVAHYSGMPVTN